MFQRWFGISGVFFMMVLPVGAFEVGGVTFPDSLSAGHYELQLNGAGLRTKWFVSVYAGALYLLEKDPEPDRIIEADDPMAIRLQIVYSGVTGQKMTDAMNEGFENATQGDTTSIRDDIATFNSFFQEEITVNDVFDIIYTPDEGVRVFKNNLLKGSISGLEFKQAVFGIWLCDKPADKNLKKKMLGI